MSQHLSPAAAASRPWDPFSIIIARSLVSLNSASYLLITVRISRNYSQRAHQKDLFPLPFLKDGPRKCSNAVCVSCIAKLNGLSFRCSCGDEPKIDSTLWVIGAYNSVMNAFNLITGAKPAGASEGYTAMPSRSQALSAPNPLLLPPAPAASTALPQHRTLCQEMLPPTALPPPPQPLPLLLGHRRRASHVADVFKTHLPGEMPCSPMSR